MLAGSASWTSPAEAPVTALPNRLWPPLLAIAPSISAPPPLPATMLFATVVVVGKKGLGQEDAVVVAGDRAVGQVEAIVHGPDRTAGLVPLIVLSVMFSLLATE